MSATAGGAAVGVRLTGDPLPGLIADVEEPLPAVAVEVKEEGVLGERWKDAPSPELIFERPFRDGRPFLRVERDELAGYRVSAIQHGTHLIDREGTRCASALPDAPPWQTVKLLAAQALPLLALLRGREVLHAAGVVVDDHLVGIVAPSGTGKSATTCNLIAHGGRFFADDVLALELVDGQVRAHPGTRMLNVRAHDLEAIPASLRGRLGEAVGTSDKAHVEPEGFPRSLPLSGLLFLDRGPHVAETGMFPVEDASARLLGNAFLPYLDRAERLARQLDVMSAVARTVALARLAIGPDDSPDKLVPVVREWAGRLS